MKALVLSTWIISLMIMIITAESLNAIFAISLVVCCITSYLISKKEFNLNNYEKRKV